jgi:hypothetical protein
VEEDEVVDKSKYVGDAPDAIGLAEDRSLELPL